MNLEDKSKLFIHGLGDDLICLFGSLFDELPAYDGMFLFYFNDAIVQYGITQKIGPFASIIKHSPSFKTEVVFLSDDDQTPLIVAHAAISFIKVESVLSGGKIDGITYFVNESVILNQRQLKAVEELKAVFNYADVGNNIDESQVIGYVYDNFK